MQLLHKRAALPDGCFNQRVSTFGWRVETANTPFRERLVRKGAPTGVVASHDPLTHKASAGRVHESRKVRRLHISNFRCKHTAHWLEWLKRSTNKRQLGRWMFFKKHARLVGKMACALRNWYEQITTTPPNGQAYMAVAKRFKSMAWEPGMRARDASMVEPSGCGSRVQAIGHTHHAH